MPLMHGDIPENNTATGEALRLARRDHDKLIATGRCGSLYRLLPHLVPPQAARSGGALGHDTCAVPYRLALWLGLGLCVYAPAVGSCTVLGALVGPARLGAALDAALAGLGLGGAGQTSATQAMAPSVLRKRLQRKAAELRNNPLTREAFVVQAADLYAVVDGEATYDEFSELGLQERAETEAQAELERVETPDGRPRRLWQEETPDTMASFLYADLTAADHTAAIQAALEMVLWPRLVRADREGKAGAFFRLDKTLQWCMPRSEADLLEMAEGRDRAEAVADWLRTKLPLPVELEDYPKTAQAAAAALVRAMRRIRDLGSSSVVTEFEVAVAIQHFDTIYWAVGREAAPAAIMGQLFELCRAALRSDVKNITLGHLASVETAVLYLIEPVKQKSRAGVPSDTIISFISTELLERRRQETMSTRGTGGETSTPGGEVH